MKENRYLYTCELCNSGITVNKSKIEMDIDPTARHVTLGGEIMNLTINSPQFDTAIFTGYDYIEGYGCPKRIPKTINFIIYSTTEYEFPKDLKIFINRYF